ncbi:uncharacterized protein N0V89_000018 [Didymosphaeria variabile]|uniref:Rhodopsin domain-containing protein n=1 Tax=Didymosphaeria variabile TaxID=1932322 RepID=A0A9W9CFB1_9PLEO|nr:uncharacterized protein N0V89_000018 [Didymosphaeria variabile]KAJ4359464.1 hypothetical protein N0V89_000018 [Didymosphaeria variabile]
MPATGPDELTEYGVRTIVITVVFSSLATLAVIGRFWSRYLTAFKPALEDYLVVAALIVTWGYAAGNIVFSYNGLGVQAASLIAAGRNYQLQNQLKLLIANQVTYAIALGLVKTSLILSLIRIFHVSKTFRIVAYLTMTLCICWTLQTILIAFLICRPISYNWDQVNQTGSCGDLTAAYVSIGIVDVITDIIIFILPLPLISRLKMRRSTRFATMGLFALGVFTVAAGAARTGMIYHTRFDPTDPEGPTMNLIWAAVEPCVAIVVASLLVTKPLFVFASARVSSLISSLPYASAWSSKGTTKDSSYNNTIGTATTRSKAGYNKQRSDSEEELRNLEHGKIWQTTEVHVDECEASPAPQGRGENPAYPKMAV